MIARNVVFIDGPLKDSVHCVENAPMYDPEEPPTFSEGSLSVGPDDELRSPRIEPRRYTIYRYMLFGKIILIGSIRRFPEDFTNDDLYNALVSENAKQATLAE